MGKTIKVKTPPGLKCPLERNHRKYITDDEKGTEVTDSPYYRRLMNEGSLLEVTDQPADPPADPPVKALVKAPKGDKTAAANNDGGAN